MSIYQRLTEVRKKLKISQTELANLLNCSQPNISDYEKGKIALPISALSIISKTYNVSMEWLVDGEGEMFKQNNPVIKVQPDAITKSQLEQELLACQKELLQLRKQNTLLKTENQELNAEIKEKLKKIIALQDKLINI